MVERAAITSAGVRWRCGVMASGSCPVPWQREQGLASSFMVSLLAENEVDHPAAANVWVAKGTPLIFGLVER